MKTTKYIRIKVSPAAKQIVEQIADAEDMTEQGVASRVYEWFGSLPRTIQLAIISRYPAEIAPDLAKLILQQLTHNAKANLAAERGPSKRTGSKKR